MESRIREPRQRAALRSKCLRARFTDVAEEAKAELLPVPVRRRLPLVEPREQALASRPQVGARIELQQSLQRPVEALVAELAEQVGQALRVVAQAVHLESDRARVGLVAD